MKVYFSHGKESGPWGSKITTLATIAKAHGCSVENIDYSDTFDPDIRAQRLVNILKNEQEEYILVGSSMGGYASVVAAASTNPKAVFLLAPALFINSYRQQTYAPNGNIEIVHGWADDIIPPENSIRFAKSIHCSLHLIPGDHRLNSSMHLVEPLFSQFLAAQLGIFPKNSSI